MKRFDIPNINTSGYWDSHQTALDFGLRQDKYRELAGDPFNRKIVELGCGLSPFLAKTEFEEKWGLDFSPQTIISAKEVYKDVVYTLGDVTKTSFPDKYFDVSVCGEVIEHLENPDDLIKEMVRITKDRIIISSPILEFQDPEHLWEFSDDDLGTMLCVYGPTKVETVESERFPGRKYIFASCDLK